MASSSDIERRYYILYWLSTVQSSKKATQNKIAADRISQLAAYSLSSFTYILHIYVYVLSKHFFWQYRRSKKKICSGRRRRRVALIGGGGGVTKIQISSAVHSFLISPSKTLFTVGERKRDTITPETHMLQCFYIPVYTPPPPTQPTASFA